MASYRKTDSSDHYVQIKDFAFPDTVFGSAPFVPTFFGSYDGRGHKITHLAIYTADNNSGIPRLGLFSAIDSVSVIQNIILELDSKGIKADVSANCGGITGWAWKSVITNCSVKGNILLPKDVGGYPGGVSGFNYNVTMTGCSFRGRMTGSNVGGLMGSVSSSKVNMCYAYFSFDAFAAGGIAAVPSPEAIPEISNSYVVVYDYSASTFVAIGPVNYQIANGVITNCFANAGAAQDGVTIFSSVIDINTHLSTLTIADWPAGIAAPADKKPFKYDADLTAPMKLWWE
jgi:hypothetical protein